MAQMKGASKRVTQGLRRRAKTDRPNDQKREAQEEQEQLKRLRSNTAEDLGCLLYTSPSPRD